MFGETDVGRADATLYKDECCAVRSGKGVNFEARSTNGAPQNRELFRATPADHPVADVVDGSRLFWSAFHAPKPFPRGSVTRLIARHWIRNKDLSDSIHTRYFFTFSGTRRGLSGSSGTSHNGMLLVGSARISANVVFANASST